MRIFLAAITLLAATSATAAPLGLVPVASPRLIINTEGFLDDGFLLLTGDVVGQPVGLGLSDYEISGVWGDAISVFLFDNPDAVDPAIEGSLIASGFMDDRLEFLFGTLVDNTGLFGGRLLVLIDGASFTGDPFASGFGVEGGTGIVAAPVPLPAPAALLVAALAGLCLASRRRRGMAHV